MPKITQKQVQRHFRLIQYKLKQIFFQKNDERLSQKSNPEIRSIKSLESINTFYITQLHREQIFHVEYPMEKKGKTFGSSEIRQIKFIREKQQIQQIDKNGALKILPTPNDFQFQMKESIDKSNEMQWNNKFECMNYRIKLKFDQRGEVWVYFEKRQNFMQIGTFIKSLIQKQKGKLKSFFYCIKLQNDNVFDDFSNKLRRFALEVEKRKISKNTEKILRTIQMQLNDKIYIREMLQKWRQNTVNSQIKHNIEQIDFQVKVMKIFSTIKLDQDNISLKIQSQKQSSQCALALSPLNGNTDVCEYKILNQSQSCNFGLKLAMKDKISMKMNLVRNNEANKQQKKQSLYISEFNIWQIKYGGKNLIRQWTQKQNIFEQSRKDKLTNTVHLKLVNPQIQKLQKNDGLECICSIDKCDKECSTSEINQIFSGKHNGQNHWVTMVFKCFLNRNDSPNMYTSNEKYILMNKDWLPFIQSQCNQSFIQDKIQTIQVQKENEDSGKINTNIQKQDQQSLFLVDSLNSYHKYVQQTYPIQIGFNYVEKLNKQLNIDSLIEKLLVSQIFKQCRQKQVKGTRIYQQLMKSTLNFKCYDVQKLVIKYNCPQIRRLLNTIKRFDQNPKINFTSPFFLVCYRISAIVSNQIDFHKNKNFQDTITGRQSCSFMIILSLLKQFSKLLIYTNQPEKKTLHSNTLLFRYVLKKSYPSISKKCIRLELNVEALFGMALCSLLSEFFSDLLFTELIIWQVKQLKKQTNIKIYTVFIAAFLCLLQMVINESEHQIQTAESLIVYLKEKSRTLSNPLYFLVQVTETIKIVDSFIDQEYLGLSEQLHSLYKSTQINQKLTFGELSLAVYEQFSHAEHSNRDKKVYLWIQKIRIKSNEAINKLSIQISQGKQILYSHSFKNISLQEFKLSLSLEAKSLQSFIVKFKTYQSNLNSFRKQQNTKSSHSTHEFTIDIARFSPNTHHHRIHPLINNKRSATNHVQYQIYIKNDSNPQHFENPIPQKYHQTFLYNQSISQEIVECGKIIKNYRIPEHNFNLLYTKLNWYNNHYLIPHHRLLGISAYHNDYANINKDQDRLYQVLEYGRTIFGRGIIPKQNIGTSKFLADIVKNNVRIIKFTSKTQNYQEQEQQPMSQKLLIPALDNFDMKDDYYSFFEQMSQLPLIDYLTYDPIKYLVLPSFQFTATYINPLSQVKIPFIVHFCDSEQDRKQSEPYNILEVFNYSQHAMNVLQQQFTKIQDHFFGSDQSLIIQDRRVNRFGLGSTTKQFSQFFPKCFNFSHLEYGTSVDEFAQILKFNILHCLVSKFHKTRHNSFFNLKNKINAQYNTQIGEYNNAQSKSNENLYRLQFLHGSKDIPNSSYYYLFTFMVEAPLEQKVTIQLKKISSSSSKILQQSSLLHNLVGKNTQGYSLRQNYGLIHGKMQPIQIFNKIPDQTLSSQYIVQQTKTRKKYVLQQDDILWLNQDQKASFNNYSLS